MTYRYGFTEAQQNDGTADRAREFFNANYAADFQALSPWDPKRQVIQDEAWKAFLAQDEPAAKAQQAKNERNSQILNDIGYNPETAAAQQQQLTNQNLQTIEAANPGLISSQLEGFTAAPVETEPKGMLTASQPASQPASGFEAYGSFKEYVDGEIGERDDKWMKGINEVYTNEEFIDKFKGELPILEQYVDNPASLPRALKSTFSYNGHIIDSASSNSPELKQNLASLLATDRSDPNFNVDTYNVLLLKAGQEIADNVKTIHTEAFNYYDFKGLPTDGIDSAGRTLANTLEDFVSPFLRSQGIENPSKAVEAYSLNYISPSFTAQANAEQYFRDNPLQGTPAQNQQNFEALNNELLGQLDSNDPYASAVVNDTNYSTTERGGFINIRDTVTGGLSAISPISTDLVSDIIRGTGVIASFTPLGPAALAITNVADQAFNSLLTEGDFSQVDPVALAGAVVSTAAGVANIDAEQAARDAAANGGTQEQINQARQAVLDDQGNTAILTNVVADNFDTISQLDFEGDPLGAIGDLKGIYDDYIGLGGTLEFGEFAEDLFDGESSFDFDVDFDFITDPLKAGIATVGEIAGNALDVAQDIGAKLGLTEENVKALASNLEQLVDETGLTKENLVNLGNDLEALIDSTGLTKENLTALTGDFEEFVDDFGLTRENLEAGISAVGELASGAYDFAAEQGQAAIDFTKEQISNVEQQLDALGLTQDNLGNVVDSLGNKIGTVAEFAEQGLITLEGKIDDLGLTQDNLESALNALGESTVAGFQTLEEGLDALGLTQDNLGNIVDGLGNTIATAQDFAKKGFAAVDERFDQFGNFVGEKFEAVGQRFDEFGNAVATQFDEFGNSVQGKFDEFGNFVEGKFDEFGNFVEGKFEAVDQRFDQFGNLISEGFSDIRDFAAEGIEGVGQRLDEFGNTVATRFDEFGNAVQGKFDEFGNFVEGKFDQFGNFVEGKFDAVAAQFDEFGNYIGDKFSDIDLNFEGIDTKFGSLDTDIAGLNVDLGALAGAFQQEQEQAANARAVQAAKFDPLEEIVLQEYDLNADQDVLGDTLRSLQSIRV